MKNTIDNACEICNKSTGTHWIEYQAGSEWCRDWSCEECNPSDFTEESMRRGEEGGCSR